MSARRPETKPARTIEPASKPKSTNGRAVSPYGYPFWDWVAREDPEYVAARQPLSQLSIGEGKALSIKHREMVIIGILAFRGTKDGVVAHMRRAIEHGASKRELLEEIGATMARLRPLELHEVDDDVRAICHEVERNSGTSASARTMAHHPPAVKALTAFRKALAKESVLDPTLIELVRLKVAERNACHY